MLKVWATARLMNFGTFLRKPQLTLTDAAKTGLSLIRRIIYTNYKYNFTCCCPDSEPSPIDNDGVEIPPPSHNKIKVAIQRLKNNKTAGPVGFPAELFKAGGDDLVRSIHQLICRIWLEESMPSDWNLSALCPVLKMRYAPTIGVKAFLYCI